MYVLQLLVMYCNSWDPEYYLIAIHANQARAANASSSRIFSFTDLGPGAGDNDSAVATHGS